MMKFSPSTTLLYDPFINADGIPDDAVEISREEFQALVEARAAGHTIEADAEGRPVVIPPAEPTLAERKARLVMLATDWRWEVETSGITLPSGAQIATGKADQDRITSVVVNAQLAGINSVDFKTTGGWARLSLEEVTDIARAVARHVQLCFSAERAHHEAISALATAAEVEAYDISAGWPAPEAAARALAALE